MIFSSKLVAKDVNDDFDAADADVDCWLNSGIAVAGNASSLLSEPGGMDRQCCHASRVASVH